MSRLRFRTEPVIGVMPGHQPTATRVRRLATFRKIGAYARNPCPHAITSWDEIDDPVREDGRIRRLTRRTVSVCERTAGHATAEKASPHRTSDGREWW